MEVTNGTHINKGDKYDMNSQFELVVSGALLT